MRRPACSGRAQRPGCLETQPFARQELGFAEGAQVAQILGLRLHQAALGAMSVGVKRATAAQRGTKGPLPAKPEGAAPASTAKSSKPATSGMAKAAVGGSDAATSE